MGCFIVRTVWIIYSMVFLTWMRGIGLEAAPPAKVTIGVLLGDRQGDQNVKIAVQMAINSINANPDILPSTKLNFIYTNTNSPMDTFENIQNTYFLIEQGAVIVIGPASSNAVKATHPICAALNVPQIAPFSTDPSLSLDEEQFPYLLKMSAPDTAQSESLIDLMKHFGWTRFSLIASKQEFGRAGLQSFERMTIQLGWEILSSDIYDPVDTDSKTTIPSILMNIKSKGARVVVLNCVHSKVILARAKKMGMLEKGWAWIVIDNDIVGYQDIPPDMDTCELRGLLGIRPTIGKGMAFPNFRGDWGNATSIMENQEVRSMKAYDSVLIASYGLHNYFVDGHGLKPHKKPKKMRAKCLCSKSGPKPRNEGRELYRYIKQAEGPGVISHLNFTEDGNPWGTQYDIVNLQREGWIKVGNWTTTQPTHLQLDRQERFLFPGNQGQAPSDTFADLRGVHLKVTTIVEEPFVIENNQSMYPTQPFRGFCIDMLNKLQDELGFTYTIHHVADGQFGYQDPKTKRWNGLVGEVIDGKANMALAPIHIRREREKYVSFTRTYLDLGLTILMARERSDRHLFSILEPFKWDLWIAVVGSMFAVGVAVTICSCFSPYGYHGRHVQRVTRDDGQYKEQSKTFNLYNGLWFAFASFIQQGGEATPRCFSGRVVAGFWWCAVMIIYASYTANLAAFLTVSRLDTGINNIYDLANQYEIDYGTVKGTAIERYFAMQDYEPFKKMSSYWNESEHTWVTSASQGIDRVHSSYEIPKGSPGRYAFIYDSTVLEYVARNKPCVTTNVGRPFSRVGYGIPLQKNSPYTETFNAMILKLRESGYLEGLEKKWITGPCKAASGTSTEHAGERLDLKSMRGVFYWLCIGAGLGVFIIFVEFCLASYREAVKSDKPPPPEKPKTCGEAIKRRLRWVRKDIKHHLYRRCRTTRHAPKKPPTNGDYTGVVDQSRVNNYIEYGHPDIEYHGRQTQNKEFGTPVVIEMQRRGTGPDDVNGYGVRVMAKNCQKPRRGPYRTNEHDV